MSSEGKGELSNCSRVMPLPETFGAIHRSALARQRVTASSLFTMISSVGVAVSGHEIALTICGRIVDRRTLIRSTGRLKRRISVVTGCAYLLDAHICLPDSRLSANTSSPPPVKYTTPLATVAGDNEPYWLGVGNLHLWRPVLVSSATMKAPLSSTSKSPESDRKVLRSNCRAFKPYLASTAYPVCSP